MMRYTLPSGRDMLFSREDIRRLLIPLLLEQTLAVTIGMMDTVMVSSCGEASVSGVSLVDSIALLLIQVFSALATGGAVVCSQYLGKRDMEHARSSAKQLYYVVLIASIGISAFCLATGRGLLSLIFGAIEADVMDAAVVYFHITVLSYPFLAAYSASAALLRSMGDSRSTLYTSIVMNVINVAGNALTIYGLGMGAAGAALATLVSRMAGCFVARLPLKRPTSAIPCPVLHAWEWRGDIIRKILSVGVPNGLENGLFQFGKLVLVRMISTFGTVSIAANAVGNTIGSIHALPGNAVSLAMITVVGQCVGAKAYDQARYYTKELMKQAYLWMGLLNIGILLANGVICRPFHLSEETERLARMIVAIHGAGCVVLWPMSFVFPNSLRAAGDARFTMLVSSFSMIAFRVVFGVILGRHLEMGVIGVWVAMQIDWVFRIVCWIVRYRSGKWERMALV